MLMGEGVFELNDVDPKDTVCPFENKCFRLLRPGVFYCSNIHVSAGDVELSA